MALTLNKAVRANVVNAAIKDKYQSRFEKALKAFEVAAHKHAIKNSHHEQFTALGLKPEMMSHVKSKHGIELQSSIVLEGVDFADGRWISTVRFNSGVYGYHGGYYLERKHIKQLPDLECLVKEILHERSQLAGVLGSYRNVKKLISDLPWVEKYLPEASKPSTGLIAVDVINDINAKFGK